MTSVSFHLLGDTPKGYLFELLHSAYRTKKRGSVTNDDEIFDHVADVWCKRYRRFTREFISYYLKNRPCTLLE